MWQYMLFVCPSSSGNLLRPSTHDSSHIASMLNACRKTPRRAAAKEPTAKATKKRAAPALESATIEKDDLEEMADVPQGGGGAKSRARHHVFGEQVANGTTSARGGHKKRAST